MEGLSIELFIKYHEDQNSIFFNQMIFGKDLGQYHQRPSLKMGDRLTQAKSEQHELQQLTWATSNIISNHDLWNF